MTLGTSLALVSQETVQVENTFTSCFANVKINHQFKVQGSEAFFSHIPVI